jgi:heat shock protein HslJ
MRNSPILTTLLLLTACAQQESAQAPNNEAANSVTPAAVTSVPALDGEWLVAAIDGKAVAGESAMTASFGDGKARISAGCSRRAWTYTQERNVVAFSADPGGSSNCAGGTSAEHEAAFAALEGASIAIFDKEGKEASLSGGGGNLTLQRR